MDCEAAARRWAATWTAAWRTHEVEPVVALYAEDSVHRSTPFRPPHRGRQAVRGYRHLQEGHQQPPQEWAG